MTQNVHPDTQNTNTDSSKTSQTRTHIHHTYTELDEWPADRCDAVLTKEAVCSQIEMVARYRQQRERSKEREDKGNCHFSKMITFHKSKGKSALILG